MELKVLGCSGGVGGQLRTTTLLIDDDVLIDAGTGLGDLNLQSMASVRHIFLTHSHLDHITSIPLISLVCPMPIILSCGTRLCSQGKPLN
jgi:phosphoribosyl 1,2-cyclic phosphodiesterase